MSRSKTPANRPAAQKAQAQKAAAVKAGAPTVAPPVLEPGEWVNIMTCMDQVVRSGGQLGGLQGAAALLGTAGKIQQYLDKVQAQSQSQNQATQTAPAG